MGTVSGLVAASLIWEGKTGYATTVRGLNSPASRWRMGGIPLTSMMAIKGKSQYGINQLLIPSSVVDLSAPAF